MTPKLMVNLKPVGELGRGLLELLYPRRCFLCEGPLSPIEGFICSGCLEGLPRVEPPLCELCGAPLEDEALDLCSECATRQRGFELARSFGYYEGRLARLIQGLKYEREGALARELAPYLLWAGGSLLARAEALTFVPMTRRVRRSRGFNQAELLARELGGLTGLRVVPALRKVRETPSQAQLRGRERRENVRGAFAPHRGSTARGLRCIALIDDVYTTGATAEECSRALKAAGWREVYVLTVARTRSGGGAGPGSSSASEFESGSEPESPTETEPKPKEGAHTRDGD